MKYGGVKAKHVAFGGLGVVVVVGIVLIILWQTGVIFKKSSPAVPGAPGVSPSLIGPGGTSRYGPLGPGGTSNYGPLGPGGQHLIGPGGTSNYGPLGPGGQHMIGPGGQNI